MNGQQIQRSSAIKYLGVTMEQNLRFNLHCKNVLQQARNAASRLYKFIGYYGNLNTRNKLTIYKTCVRSLLTYNIQVWNDVSKSNMKKLESFQNKCLRQCINLRTNPVTYRQVPTQVVHLQSKILLIYVNIGMKF